MTASARTCPLQGHRVIDLSKVLAGPLCAQHLGELGAEVIKIEPVGSGDDSRILEPQLQGQAAMFLAVNHNKRSLALDLRQPAGQQVVHLLAASADTVIQGFGGGVAARLGVDHATLARINPRLIYCEISGYGRSEPLGKEPGYDGMLQAFSGMVSTLGMVGSPYTRASFAPIDLGTGMNAVAGILAALIERGRSGRGVHVEVSLLDTAMSLMGVLAQSYWCSGQVPGRVGSVPPALAPYGIFEAADGHLMLGVGNDAQWRRFCVVAGLDDCLHDERFATNEARVAHVAEIAALVAARMRSRTVEVWLELLRDARIACSPIHDLAQALAHPQLAARELVVKARHATLGEVRNMGFPAKFDGHAREARRPAPLVGEHSREVLREAGYSEQEVEEMVERGVVGVSGPRA